MEWSWRLIFWWCQYQKRNTLYLSTFISYSPNFLKTLPYGDSQEDTKSETFHSDLSGNSLTLPFCTFTSDAGIKADRLVRVLSLLQNQRFMSYRRYRHRTYRLLYIVNECTVRLRAALQCRSKSLGHIVVKHRVEPAIYRSYLAWSYPSFIMHDVIELDIPLFW